MASLDRTARQTDIAPGQIVETGRRDGIVELEFVALARAIGSLDQQRAILGCQIRRPGNSRQ